jgi:hypothetical protein
MVALALVGVTATVRAAPWCHCVLVASAIVMLLTLAPAFVVQSNFTPDCAPGVAGKMPPGAPQPVTAPAGAARIGIAAAVAIATAANAEPNFRRRMNRSPC